MLKKQFLEMRPVCRVEFSLPESVQAETVYLVGDFNNWDEAATPMQREHDHSYLVNRVEWHNDWMADKYVPNPYSGDNSVVVTIEER